MPTVTDEEEKDRKPQEAAVQNGEKAKPEESSGRKPGESPNGKGQGDESAKKGDSAEKDDDKKEKEKPVDPATKRRRIIIGVGVGIVVLIAGIAWWLYSRTYESTDDAQSTATSTRSPPVWPGR